MTASREPCLTASARLRCSYPLRTRTILAHPPDVFMASGRCHRFAPPAVITPHAARHRVNKGRSDFSDLKKPVLLPKGRERRRRGAEPHVVMADLSTSEPLAERLRCIRAEVIPIR